MSSRLGSYLSHSMYEMRRRVIPVAVPSYDRLKFLSSRSRLIFSPNETSIVITASIL